MAACSLSLGCVLVRDEQQDTRYQIDEDERAHAERNGVSARTLVDAPADDRHRDHPSERDDEPRPPYAGDDVQDESDQAQHAVLAGHGVDLLRIEHLIGGV